MSCSTRGLRQLANDIFFYTWWYRRTNSPCHIPWTIAVFARKRGFMFMEDFLSRGRWGIQVRTIRWVCFDPNFLCFNKVFSFPDVWSLGSYSWTQHGFGSVRYRGRYLITVTVEAPLTDTRKPIALRTLALTKHSLTLCLQEAFPSTATSSCGQVFCLPKTSTKGCFECNQWRNFFSHKICLDLIGFI